MLLDPNRLNRVHVVGVRNIKEKWFVILSDGSELPWGLLPDRGG